MLALVDPETGWFDRAGFSAQQHADRVAFTHTIAYTLWGVQMSSELLADPEGIAAATKAAWAIARRLELERSLGGILDHRWRRRADFSCVTGAAQMALVWMRQFERDGDIRLVNAALLAIDTVKRAQPMRTANRGLLGGIPGSDPVWGEYIRFAYPNWAAKFFIDALLAKRRTLQLVRQARQGEQPALDVIARFFPQMAGTRPPAEDNDAIASSIAPRDHRVVLYAAPSSTKVAQMLAAWRSWGFRPAAVVIESRPPASTRRRLTLQLRERGLAAVWHSVIARFGKSRAGTSGGGGAGTGEQLLLPREACRRDGIPVVDVASLATPEGVAAVAALRPDLAVHAGAGILRDAILRVPRFGTLNAHMGVLPRYRGMNVAEWAALEGGPVGCSVHFVAPGIDTGPVLEIRVVHTGHVRSINALREAVDARQIALLGEVLRAAWERGPETLHSVEQPASGGLQFFRMHQELQELLRERLSAG